MSPERAGPDARSAALMELAGVPEAVLTGRFLDAVRLATQIRGRQRRTGTEIPYLAHLLVVTGLVIEDGGDEDQAIAAMLHDAVEDRGGRPLLDRIRDSFGTRVAGIVEGCSDSVDIDASEGWIARKRRYVAHLHEVRDEAILRVALADKVHNARSLVRELREKGGVLWERFPEKTAREQLWYYGGMLSFFQARRAGGLTADLDHAVTELAWLVAVDTARQTDRLAVWVDRDLHGQQAPDGWLQVRTADEAILLLEEFPVRALSVHGLAEADRLVRWLAGRETEGLDRWPTEGIVFHSEHATAIQELIRPVDRRRRLRPSIQGNRPSDGPPGPVRPAEADCDIPGGHR